MARSLWRWWVPTALSETERVQGWEDADGFDGQVDSITDVTRDQLKVIKETRTHDPKIITELKKRRLLRMQKVISFRIAKGPKYALEMVKEETDLTAEMIASGAWKTATFKPYNFNALGADQRAGALHPLNKVRQEFRQIFFEMGFTEMPTNQFVESGFWVCCPLWYSVYGREIY